MFARDRPGDGELRLFKQTSENIEMTIPPSIFRIGISAKHGQTCGLQLSSASRLRCRVNSVLVRGDTRHGSLVRIASSAHIYGRPGPTRRARRFNEMKGPANDLKTDGCRAPQPFSRNRIRIRIRNSTRICPRRPLYRMKRSDNLSSQEVGQ